MNLLEAYLQKGLIEVQNTRPKKYKIRNPKRAFQNILSKKTIESEVRIKKFKENFNSNRGRNN